MCVSWELILCKTACCIVQSLVWYKLKKECAWVQLGLQISALIIEIYTVHGSFAFNINTHLLQWQGACSLVDWTDALEHRCLAMMGLEKSPTKHCSWHFLCRTSLPGACHTEASLFRPDVMTATVCLQKFLFIIKSKKSQDEVTFESGNYTILILQF